MTKAAQADCAVATPEPSAGSCRGAWLDVAVAALVIVAALAAINEASLRIAMRNGTRLSGATVAASVSGSTPYRWEMEHPAELVLESSRGLDRLSIEGGSLAFDAGPDCILYLDLGGSVVDAYRYCVFRAEWEFSVPVRFQIHFWEPGCAVPRASEYVNLPAGRQEFGYDLRDIGFHEVIPFVEPRLRWGGHSGAVSRLRLDFGDEGGISVRIDRLSLDRAPGTTKDPSAVKRLRSALADREAGRPSALRSAGFSFGPPPMDSVPGRFDSVFLSRDAYGAPGGVFGVAESWGSTVDFFETPFRWLTPEELVDWSWKWRSAPSAPLFPGMVSPGDIPPGVPAVPGMIRRDESQEPLRFGVFAFALALGALWASSLARASFPGRAWFDAAAAAAMCLAFATVLNVFPVPGSDARAVIAFALPFAASVAAAVSRGLDGLALNTGSGGFKRAALEAIRKMLIGGDRQAVAVVACVTAAAAISAVLAGHATGSLWYKPGFAERIPEYLGKSMVQQALLCPIVAGAMRRAFGGRVEAAAAASGALFAALHVPNYTLAVSTLVMGYFWSRIYLKHGGLAPIVASHGLLGALAASVWSAPLLASHRVGLMFFLP